MRDQRTGDGPAVSYSLALPIATMAVLGVALGTFGYFYIKNQRAISDQDIHLRLSAVAHDKAVQVAAWRAERTGDARVAAKLFELLPQPQRVFSGTANADERSRVQQLLETFRAQYGYVGLTVFDNQRKAVLSAGDPVEFADLDAERSRFPSPPDILFGEIHKERNSGAFRIHIISPVVAGGSATAGFVVLNIDPTQQLFLMLRDWPEGGASGVLALLRREGNYVVLLNEPHVPPELQGHGPFALGRGTSVSNIRLPAVQAVVRGDGTADGIDSWGLASVASAATVPGSDWHILAKAYRSEIFAPEDANGRLVIYLIVAAMLLSGAAVELYLRRRSQRYFREKYQAELERNALRGRYESLNRYASDAILIWDEEGRILEANNSAARMFGYSSDELVGMNLSKLKPPDRQGEYSQILSSMAVGTPAVFETVNMRKDGSVFPTEVGACRIDIDERRLGQSFIRDITERRKAEEQIKALNRMYAVLSRCNAAIIRAEDEEQLFRDICRIAVETGGFLLAWLGRVDTTSESISLVVVEGPEASYMGEIKISLTGPASEGPTGSCIRQGKPVPFADFDTNPATMLWRDAAVRHGIRSTISLPIVKDGRAAFVFAMYSSEPAFFSAPEVALAEEIAAGLSHALAGFELRRDRLDAELERALATERLERAFEVASEGFCDWDVPSGEIYVSPRYYAIMGYEPGEVMVDPDFLADAVHPDDRQEFEEERRKILSGGADQALARFRVWHKDRNYVWVLSKMGVVSRDDAGKPFRVVETRLDITERKILEQDFLQAQKMESVGRLAGGVAHDFNNHLTVITGYSQLLREHLPAGSAMAGILKTIMEAGERAASLTRQLLTFSRKEFETREPIRPDEVITSLGKMLYHLTGEKVNLVFELDPAVGFVMMDRTHLEQIVMNLTVNARDAIKTTGTVTVAAACEQVKGTPFAVLAVTDDGCGMTEEIRHHIFEPFYTTKDRAHGTGLGLATVYGIVERNGGFIEVESAPDEGTTFRIYIPSLTAYEPTEEKQVEAEVPLGSGQTILVVEDEELVRRTAVDVLRHYGYKARAAKNAAEAISIAEGSIEIDAALIDLVMPGMNGAELGEILIGMRPGLKVLYASGYADESIRLEELLRSGARFLPKPYNPEVLAATIGDLLKPHVYGAAS